MDRTNIGPPPIPITGMAKVPCQNRTIYCKKKQHIVRRYMGMTDRINNANKVKSIAHNKKRHAFNVLEYPICLYLRFQFP